MDKPNRAYLDRRPNLAAQLHIRCTALHCSLSRYLVDTACTVSQHLDRGHCNPAYTLHTTFPLQQSLESTIHMVYWVCYPSQLDPEGM